MNACPKCQHPMPTFLELKTEPESAIVPILEVTLRAECPNCHRAINLWIRLHQNETRGKVLQ